MKPANFQEINFSPFANNVLDYVGAEGLQTASGKPVEIKSDGMNFVITIDYSRYTSLSNLDASYLLNCWQVGRKS